MLSANNALREHWPEYLMEAAGLGIFMISTALFTVILEHPASLKKTIFAYPTGASDISNMV